jgi:hypothetical protein
MENILTQEDKIYLGRICRYLGSLGMTHGNIEFDTDYSDFDFDAVDWTQVTHFSNNYTAEIPEGLIEIFQRIFTHISDEGLFESPDVDGYNWGRVEIDLHCDSGEISVSFTYSYYDTGDTSSDEWSLEDEDEITDIFDQIQNELDEANASEDTLTLRYNGSGDSGYIESDFEEGYNVPAVIEDWCYYKLESMYGGWEINEGSEGEFIFDIQNKTVTLEHTNNMEETVTNTIWEEEF